MSKKTNVQFIVDLMENAKTSPLMQAFVINAVLADAETTAAWTDEDIANIEKARKNIVHPNAWREVAKEVLDKYKKHKEG